MISDATETMLSGAALLRGSIGIFGMLCVAAICFVPFVRAGASYLCYKAGAAVLSPLCSDGMKRFLENVGTGFGLLLGMLSTCCMILFLELVYMVAMALKLAGGGALKEVVRTAAGLLMLLALLQPLAGLHVLSWNWQGSVSQSDIDEMQARNMQTTMSTVAASIAKAVQQRAEEAGIPCTVNVEMANDADGLLQVDKVTVYYDSADESRLSELQSLLTKECGVPAERQELIAR